MPKAYTYEDLKAVYDEIALERRKVCDECGIGYRLSHSHLAPKGHFQRLVTCKDNIVYHCLSVGDIVGCHDRFESSEVARMKNFEKYFKKMFSFGPDVQKHVWSRLFKLEEIWLRRDMETYRRVRALMAELDKIAHPKVVSR